MICDGKQKPLAKTRGFHYIYEANYSRAKFRFAVIAHQPNFVIGKPYCFERFCSRDKQYTLRQHRVVSIFWIPVTP